MTDLGDLKHRIRTEWDKLDYAVISAVQCIIGVISQTASRLAAVISSTVFDLDDVFSSNCDLPYCC